MDNFAKLKEKCGIFGSFSTTEQNILRPAVYGLSVLQHRGQEAAGVATLKRGTIKTDKDFGLVLNKFSKYFGDNEENKKIKLDYLGIASIGHVLYSTAGSKDNKHNIQPLYEEDVSENKTLAIAHNGNLINDLELKAKLEQEGFTFGSGCSDSEVILKLLHKHLTKEKMSIVDAIKQTCAKIKGAYSLLIMTQDCIAAVRDPYGYRPLSLGTINNESFYFSSESCAFEALDIEMVREIEPGEIVVFKEGEQKPIIDRLEDKKPNRLCSFEHIYFARPDSVLDGQSVYSFRKQMGAKLWEQNKIDADFVIGVPDSGIPAADGYAQASGIPMANILIKSKYIARSFISTNKEIVLKLKLSPVAQEMKGKRIVVIDDSIVRGDTSRRLIELLKKTGVKEIHFRSAAPPVKAPCFFGIDTPRKDQLLASSKNIEEMREHLGVDSLDFLEIDNLKEILGAEKCCYSCYSEKYDMEIPERLLNPPAKDDTTK